MKNILMLVLGFVGFICSGCVSFRGEDAPYYASGEMVQDNNGSGWAYDFCFENKTEKTVRKVDFILSLFDYDGEPVFEQDWIKFNWENSVGPESLEKGWVILDEYFKEEPENEWLTDYFYASRIEYSDGSVFEDPYGRYIRS